MPLNFLKRTEAPKTEDPRVERSRVDDRFERHLKLALRDRQIEVRGAVILHDVLALDVPAGGTQGTLRKMPSLRLDYELFDPRAQAPVAGIVLSSRTYGRDRRRTPTPTVSDVPPGITIVTVLHLNPGALPDVLAVRQAVGPFLPD
ncbi:hypothetical protein [Deinococcus sedimenti]|uniref:Uncharacterized protein n=1 Tax=Deinococcus sedimenti TaxID=1867090 RepID=A0ABQ2S8E5_9DEIO|nr:hypothetical protein [Deinococcus sedimenti]GGS01137.1 hypothetical protein GCM10008960_29750 [Deinococcus sedimenti]